MTEYKGLRYKTCGNADPKGRPKVYFCCHPADFDRCFPVITETILKEKSNVAIWYHDPMEGIPEGDDFLTDLKQMELFVFPVSCHFLDEASAARDVEFQMALQQHIPFIPLVIEDGLEKLFDQQFGHFHALSFPLTEEAKVPAALGRQLRDMFADSLQREADSAKITASFDARLFLSYRKKDRALAEKLIRVLRSAYPLDHVGVWFDEYIIPGEDYSKDIDDAIRDSAIFLLLATEHLNEIPNYVLDKEIPAAKGLRKPVCTVLAGLDRDQLPEGLASGWVCSLNDEADLRDTVREILKEIAYVDQALPVEQRRISARLREVLTGQRILPNWQDAEACYYEGLACLQGVLSTVDPIRAFHYIQLAAEYGLPEAARKTASMYALGQGTLLSLDGALIWQERCLDGLELLIEDEPDPGQLMLQRHVALEELTGYQTEGWAQGICAEETKEEGLLRLLDSAEELEEADLVPKNALSIEAKLFLAEHHRLAGNNNAADMWDQEVLTAMQEKNAEIPKDVYSVLSAEVDAAQGERLLQRNYKDGLQLMKKALDTLKDIEDPLAVRLRFQIAYETSRALITRGRLPEAREVLRAALQDAGEIEANEGTALDATMLYHMHLKYAICFGPRYSEEAKEALLSAEKLAARVPIKESEKASLYLVMGSQEAFAPEQRIGYFRQCILYAEYLDRMERMLMQTAARRELKKAEKLLRQGGQEKPGLAERIKNIFRQ